MARTGDTSPTDGMPEEVVEFDIRLKVTDMESKESRYCGPDEAKAWDWSDPETWRVISGWQITSYDQLVLVLYEKARKGIEEVELKVIPRFMMLSGR